MSGIVALYYKNELIKRITDSIYYSASFDEALNSVIQKYQMSVLDTGIVLNINLKLVTLRDQMLIICPIV